MEPTNNFILNQLAKSELKRISDSLDHCSLRLGEVIYAGGERKDYIYFPIDGIISVIEILEDGSSSEVALVGNEGMLGITAVLGGGSETSRAVVQSEGNAYRIPASTFLEEFRRGGELTTQVLLYIQVRYTQIVQTAVCNRHHNLQQQLCRWLLLSLDRVETNALSMTQELIAGMLGVRREGITRAASVLQKQGIIEYRRGSITVVDRARLEASCCECYRVVKRETDRLFDIQRSLR